MTTEEKVEAILKTLEYVSVNMGGPVGTYLREGLADNGLFTFENPPRMPGFVIAVPKHNEE